MTKFRVFIFLLLCLGGSLFPAPYFTRYWLGPGKWKGDIGPERYVYGYLCNMQEPAVVIFQDCVNGCMAKPYALTTGYLKAYGSNIVSRTKNVAYSQLNDPSRKILRVPMTWGYRSLIVAKYYPAICCSVVTNEPYPALFERDFDICDLRIK